MTTEKIDAGNDILAKIKKVSDMLKSSQSARCDFIYFSFGDGKNKATVCEEAQVIESIRTLLITNHQTNLTSLQNDFDNL